MNYESIYGEYCNKNYNRARELITNYHSTLCHGCKIGDLDYCKWLLINASHIDISADDEALFRHSCENNRLDIAKYLLSIKPNINTSASDNFAFICCCQKGYIEIVQWLMIINKKLFTVNWFKFVFIFGILYGHMEMAKWVITERVFVKYVNNVKPELIRAILNYDWQLISYIHEDMLPLDIKNRRFKKTKRAVAH